MGIAHLTVGLLRSENRGESKERRSEDSGGFVSVVVQKRGAASDQLPLPFKPTTPYRTLPRLFYGRGIEPPAPHLSGSDTSRHIR